MKLESKLPNEIRKSYARKFTVSALLILLVVASIGAYTQAQVSADVTQQQQRSLQGNTQLEADSVKQWVDTQQRSTRSLSEHRGLASGDASEARSTVTDKIADLPSEVVALHYLNYESQNIVASTAPQVEGTQISETNIVWPFEQPFSDLSFDDSDTVIQSWIYESESGSASMAMVSPVPDTDYALVMVIETSERAEKFRSSIEGTETSIIGSATNTTLFDEDEDVILTKYDRSGAEKITAAIAANTNGTLETEDSLVAFASVSEDWVVVKRAPKSTALVVQREVQANVLALIGASIAGLLLLGGMVSRGPMRSLRELSEQATAVGNGELDNPITDTGRIDEVGQVRDGFRDIKGYLQTVADQADAIADQRFDAEVLEEDVPGQLGRSLTQMQNDLDRFITELEETRQDAEMAQEEAEALAASLEERAEEFGEVMSAAAAGDLTQRLNSDIDNDAMADIARSFNAMVAELEQTVVRIEAFAADVDRSSEEISASASEIKTASDEVSKTIQEIATGAEEQNENIQQVTDEMTDLSATVEEISSSADEVAAQSQQAAETATEGRQSGEQAADQMASIEEQATAAIQQVEKLAAEMERIGDVVTLIDDIAEQTNMLALNASIEASRAGEAGEGFGVVAEEIKGLATETQDATDNIDSMITELQSVTDDTVADIRNIGEQIETGHTTVEEATDALSEIVTQVQEANSGVQSISDATAEQATSSEEVVAMVDEVGSISEETTAQSENAAASAEEQAASVSEVTNSIRTLSDRASDLQSLVDEFTTTEETGTSDTADTDNFSSVSDHDH